MGNTIGTVKEKTSPIPLTDNNDVKKLLEKKLK